MRVYIYIYISSFEKNSCNLSLARMISTDVKRKTEKKEKRKEVKGVFVEKSSIKRNGSIYYSRSLNRQRPGNSSMALKVHRCNVIRSNEWQEVQTTWLAAREWPYNKNAIRSILIKDTVKDLSRPPSGRDPPRPDLAVYANQRLRPLMSTLRGAGGSRRLHVFQAKRYFPISSTPRQVYPRAGKWKIETEPPNARWHIDNWKFTTKEAKQTP